MADKQTNHKLERRVKALEIELAARIQENETLRKACLRAENSAESRSAKLLKTSQQLKLEVEERAETEETMKKSLARHLL